jgi:hypothetical protein
MLTQVAGVPPPRPRPTKSGPTKSLPLTLEDQQVAVRRCLVFAWFLQGDRPAATRRAALFALWNAADSERYPDAARSQIEEYIHRNVSAVGPDAFTDDEIDAFNRQRGRPPIFDPYGVWAARNR